MNALRIGICTDAVVLQQARFGARLSSPDVLLFPELMDGGYHALKQGTPPHRLKDDFVSLLRRSSQKFSCVLVGGSVFLSEGTRAATNTSLVFNRGKLIHRYDKIHLFKPTGDTELFSAGTSPVRTFTIAAQQKEIRAGVVICYDVRFPELIRAMAAQGMQILFVPARWPKARDDAWQTLLKARAIENQIFVVGCNSRDSEGGCSYAFDPVGTRIFSNADDMEKRFHVVTIDLRKLAAARTLHHNIQEAVFLKSLLAAGKKRR